MPGPRRCNFAARSLASLDRSSPPCWWAWVCSPRFRPAKSDPLRFARGRRVMPDIVTSMLSLGSGGIVGLVLGLVGGGGSILAVPLLVYVVGVKSPHVAIGTSAVAVAASALGNLPSLEKRKRQMGAAPRSSLRPVSSAHSAARRPRRRWTVRGFSRCSAGDDRRRRCSCLWPPVLGRRSRRRLTREFRPASLSRLLSRIGFTVGLFSGFFGIGGGFLIVPGLMLATGMPSIVRHRDVAVRRERLRRGDGRELRGLRLIDWPMAGLFVLGGLAGGVVGVRSGRSGRPEARPDPGLRVAGHPRRVYVVAQGFLPAAQKGE